MKPSIPKSRDNLMTSHISPTLVEFGPYKARAISGHDSSRKGYIPAFALYDRTHSGDTIIQRPISVFGGNEYVATPQLAETIGKQMLIQHFNPLVINAQVLQDMRTGDRLFIGRADLPAAKRFNQPLDIATVVQACTSTSGPLIQLGDQTIAVNSSGHLQGDKQHLMALAIDLGPATDFLSAITRLVTTRAWIEPRASLEIGDRVIFTSGPSVIGDFNLGIAEVSESTDAGYKYQVLSVGENFPQHFESTAHGAIHSGQLKGGAAIGVCLRRFAPQEWPFELSTANEQLVKGEPFISLSELTHSALFQPSRPLFNEHPQAIAALTDRDRVIVGGLQFTVTNKSSDGMLLVSYLNNQSFAANLEGFATDGSGRIIEAVLQGEHISSTLEGVEYDFKLAKEAGKLICQPVIDTTLDAILETKPGDRLVMQCAKTGRFVNASVIHGHNAETQVAIIHVEGHNLTLASSSGMTERDDGLFFAGKVNHLPFAANAATTLANLNFEDDVRQLEYRASMVDLLRRANIDLHGNLQIKAPLNADGAEYSGITISLLRQELSFFDKDYRWTGSEVPLHSQQAVDSLLAVGRLNDAARMLGNHIALTLDQTAPSHTPAAASTGMRL